MDKLASIMIWISHWCGDDVECKEIMIKCAKEHIIVWSEEKILTECWSPKK